VKTVLLVEGISDRIALETLAKRRGQSLADVQVLVLDGITNAGKAIELYGPSGRNDRLAGLCDAKEERYFARPLERAGLGSNLTGESLEALGFFLCSSDLEDELIRSLGIPRVEEILNEEGDLPGFRVFQNQPFHRERQPGQQLHRFFGTTSGRKARYAEVLVSGLDLSKLPHPLAAVLDFATERA
jgi:hypothetical protein